MYANDTSISFQSSKPSDLLEITLTSPEIVVYFAPKNVN